MPMSKLRKLAEAAGVSKSQLKAAKGEQRPKDVLIGLLRRAGAGRSSSAGLDADAAAAAAAAAAQPVSETRSALRN
eukprot:COSAG01_NODE_63831_length_278_cov_1.441341_1_plen_76_part_10